MEHRVAEPFLLAWDIVVIWPVVYLWQSAGESVVFVLGFRLGVSPEMDAGVVVELLVVLSVIMLCMILLLSSDLALGSGVLVLG